MYYLFDQKLAYSEYNSLENAMAKNPFFVVELTKIKEGRTDVNKINLFPPDPNRSPFFANSWQLTAMEGLFKGFTRMKIAGPDGEVKSFESTSSGIIGIKQLIELFQKISRHHCWESYLLLEKCKELQKQLERKEAEIEALNEDLKFLSKGVYDKTGYQVGNVNMCRIYGEGGILKLELLFKKEGEG